LSQKSDYVNVKSRDFVKKLLIKNNLFFVKKVSLHYIVQKFAYVELQALASVGYSHHIFR